MDGALRPEMVKLLKEIKQELSAFRFTRQQRMHTLRQAKAQASTTAAVSYTPLDVYKRQVDDLFSANREITENIQTISAITEEVSAHANETYHACEQNSILVNQMCIRDRL